ncbi:MAG: DUF1501 domain-containing protein [Planctomycetes bacterium]|nr:DUF1501 domain-containing protein [Planctomycetota bacterium]
MIVIPGQPIRTCEGLSRREWLRIGGLAGIGGLGLQLADHLSGRAFCAQSQPNSTSFGRAKSCIVLFLFGAPAHQDTWDMKPAAPSEVRGEFKPIATSAVGVQVCEHMPQLAKLANRYTLIRSVTHPDNTHTVAMHYMLSGVRHKRPKTNPQNALDDFPCFGAVINHQRASRRSPNGLPSAISLNSPANQVSANNHIFPGFFAGFLGAAFDPMFISQHANKPDFRPLPRLESPRRLIGRKRLLSELDQFDRIASDGNFSAYHEQAFQLLTSPAARRALDIGREPASLRERYGPTPFGQGCLLARRLVEADVPLITVNWERDDAYWDTHADNFKKHKDPLLPNLDRGFSALLEDLQQRGLLDETLVVALSEFGRTPKINKKAGRDHWAPCNTVVLAGAGIEGGQIYGASDNQAAYPTENPVRPEDLAATIYHLLGINPRTVLNTPEGQPLHLSAGEPIWNLI